MDIDLKLFSFEEMVLTALSGQKQWLEEQLTNGVPLYYDDENDNTVKKYPNGKIEVIKSCKDN